MTNSSNNNGCSPFSALNALVETDPTKPRQPGTPIRWYDCDFTPATTYTSALYDPAAREIYLLSDEDINELTEAAQPFQQAIGQYRKILRDCNKEVSKKIMAIDSDVRSRNTDTGSQYQFHQQSAKQKQQGYQQQIDQLKSEQEAIKTAREGAVTKLQQLQQSGGDTYNDQGAQSAQAKSKYNQEVALQKQAITGYDQQVEALQQQMDQLEQLSQHCDAEGYHQPCIDQANEVNQPAALAEKQQALDTARQQVIDMLDPCVQQDNIKEVVNLFKPHLPDNELEALGPYHPWMYMSEPAYEAIRSKLLGVAINWGPDGQYSFEKATGKRRRVQQQSSSASTGISQDALSGSTVQQTNQSKLKPLSFGDLKQAILQQEGLELKERDDYDTQYAQAITSSLSKFNNTPSGQDSLLNMDFSAKAAALRYASQGSLDNGYAPDLNPVGFGENIISHLDVFSGTATATGYFPCQKGVEIILKSGREMISLGVFQLKLNIELQGYAGVSTLLSANVDVSQQTVTDFIKQKVGQADKDAKANLLNGSMEASGDISTFAGVEAGCALTGSIQWGKVIGFLGYKYVIDVENINSPNQSAQKYHGSEATPAAMQLLAQLTYTINADVGAGYHGAYYIGYDQNKGQFTFAISAQICFGVGWKGAFACVIGKEAILQMIIFLYEQLKMTNFNLSKLINTVLDQMAYSNLSKLIVAAVWTGQELSDFIEQADTVIKTVQSGFEGLESAIADQFNISEEKGRLAERKNALNLAKRINDNQELICNATPKAKGNFLYHLAKYNNSNIFEPNDPEPMNAMVAILASIGSATECLNVLIHVIDKDSETPVPATKGAKRISANIKLYTGGDRRLRDEYVKILNQSNSIIINSTDQQAKEDLIAAYVLLHSAVQSSVFVKDHDISVENLYAGMHVDTTAYAQRMNEPLLAE